MMDLSANKAGRQWMQAVETAGATRQPLHMTPELLSIAPEVPGRFFGLPNVYDDQDPEGYVRVDLEVEFAELLDLGVVQFAGVGQGRSHGFVVVHPDPRAPAIHTPAEAAERRMFREGYAYAVVAQHQETGAFGIGVYKRARLNS